MNQVKKPYLKPETSVSQIEIENAICGGSVDITATNPGVGTEAQTVNETFEKNNDFTSGNTNGNSTSWDN